VLIVLEVIAVLFIERRKSGVNASAAEEATEQVSKVEDAELMLTLFGDIYTSDHKFETYLFVGTDDNGNEDPENLEDYYGAIADFINMLIIDNTDETYAILAINRDTMTYVPLMQADGTVEQLGLVQLGTAHGYGGTPELSAENTVNAVSALLGDLPIDASFVLPIAEVPKVNSLVGGVTVTIEGDLTAIDPAFKDGETITLDDEQAESFVRVRMGVGEGLNTERMERQSRYITGMKEKLAERISAEPDLGVSIFDKLKSCATTDMNGKIISRIANYMTKYTDLGTFEFEGDLDLGQSLADGIDHYEFYIDSESQVQVMTDLFSLEYSDLFVD
jgi:anionic cell wall polymer biosynthesis LytR-Cps2A-Psr (LCP) family protein